MTSSGAMISVIKGAKEKNKESKFFCFPCVKSKRIVFNRLLGKIKNDIFCEEKL